VISEDSMEIEGGAGLRGKVTAPPDKSMSHRAILLASLARGRSVLRNLLRAQDPMGTLDAVRALGVDVRDRGSAVEIHGRGLGSLAQPTGPIDCGNSGTTMRLLCGLLAAQPFSAVLQGDPSLSRRPMKRVMEPLRLMGADIEAASEDTYPPIKIRGGRLGPIRYAMPVASAQVKSAILIAGLHAEGSTTIEEPWKSRDHTERMLASLGARIMVRENRVSVGGGGALRPLDLTVPGDFSSAAFFMVAAAVLEGSDLVIRSVGLNPTRTGLLEVMQRMGARVEILEQTLSGHEPVASLRCLHAPDLRAVTVGAGEVPTLIDEIPALCVLACFARGTTTIRGAAELRVKESDRIAAMAAGLRAMGAEISELPDGLTIDGPARLEAAVLESGLDHRVAMALSVAALAARGRSTIRGVSTVATSYPGFFETLQKLW
jgi:3-phosphoshikimate 1-carboxyvinyltransferase